jgi:hypothetical protein
VPSVTGLHKPGDPGRLQALHPPLHALLQHTPWAQNPDWQSVPNVQFAPRGLRPQEAFTQ